MLLAPGDKLPLHRVISQITNTLLFTSEALNVPGPPGPPGAPGSPGHSSGVSVTIQVRLALIISSVICNYQSAYCGGCTLFHLMSHLFVILIHLTRATCFVYLFTQVTVLRSYDTMMATARRQTEGSLIYVLDKADLYLRVRDGLRQVMVQSSAPQETL